MRAELRKTVQQRYRELRALPDYVFVDNPCFRRRKLEPEIMAEMPEYEKFKLAWSKPKYIGDKNSLIRQCYISVLLTKSQEQHLFRQLNYCKFKFNQLRPKLRPTTVAVTELETFKYKIAWLEGLLVDCNQRLVVFFAKRMLHLPGRNLDDLVSLGNECLLRAVRKFDFSFGRRFNTYAGIAITNGIMRPSTKPLIASTNNEDILALITACQQEQIDCESCMAVVRKAIKTRLNARERSILSLRFGLQLTEQPLDGLGDGMTLAEIGQRLRLTRERIRQIGQGAITKLRAALASHTDLV